MRQLKCSTCRKIKPSDQFYKDRTKPRGYSYQCKTCATKYRQQPEVKRKSRVYNRARHARPGEKHKRRQRHLLNKFGLTPSQHLLMYADQNGCCAICGEAIPYNKIVTDHDHRTGKVRGLLCQGCNMRLAAIDDKEFLTRALSYVDTGEK